MLFRSWSAGNCADLGLADAIGFLVADESADELAAAVVEVRDGGQSLRDSTLTWFARKANRLSLESSLETVATAYRPD